MPYAELGCRIALGFVFLAAFVSKTRSREGFVGFRDAVAAVGVSGRRALPAAVGIAGSEITVVILLLVPSTVGEGYGVAILSLLVFAVVTSATMARGLQVPCMCFGSTGNYLSRGHLLRNAILFTVATIGLVLHTRYPQPPIGWPAVITALVGVVTGLLITRWDDISFLLEVESGRRVLASREESR